MSNPFAAKQSGMASMIESMLPQDVLDAIKLAKEQLPAVIANVQRTVERMEAKQDMILLTLHTLSSRIDPNYVPDNLPVVLPDGSLLVDGKQVMLPVSDASVTDKESSNHGGGNGSR